MTGDQPPSPPEQWGNEYERLRPTIEALTDAARDFLERLLDVQHLRPALVQARAKDRDSFQQKVATWKYRTPLTQITDLAGVRLVMYTQDEVSEVEKLLDKHFDVKIGPVDPPKEYTGLGYWGRNYVLAFKDEHLSVPFYKPYRGLVFEVQVHSLLSHAWAATTHDRTYKLHGIVPRDLRKDADMLAALLENADKTLHELVTAYERKAPELAKRIVAGDCADIEVNTISVRELVKHVFSKEHEERRLGLTFGPGDRLAYEIVQEILDCDIKDLESLRQAIPVDFFAHVPPDRKKVSIAGIVRISLMVNDPEMYFEHAWQKRWDMLAGGTLEILDEYGVDVRPWAQTKGFLLAPTKPNVQEDWLGSMDS